MRALAPALPDPTSTNDIEGLLDGVAAYWLTLDAEVSGLVRACRGGERLVLTHTPDGNRYGLEPSGTAVDTATAEAAISDARMMPEADGLLGMASAQTWRATPCA